MGRPGILLDSERRARGRLLTEQEFNGNLNSEMQFLDRQSGQVSTLLSDLPYIIVGAGVSTCAPVVIN